MRALLARKSIRISAAAAGVAALLAAAFFLAPGSGASPGGTTRQSTSPALTASAQPSSDASARPEVHGALAQALNAAVVAGTETAAQTPQPFASSTTTATTARPSTSATTATTTTTAATARPSTSATTTTTTTATTARPSTSATTTTTTTTTQNRNVVTISVRCGAVLKNMDKLKAGKAPFVPPDGIILSARTVSFTQGETVFTVLQRETRAAGIQMEFANNPMFNSVYIEGINNLYEFDCGELSGWMYKVNGWFPNYGCSQYTLKPGDVIEWVFTCDLGGDVGGGYATGTQ